LKILGINGLGVMPSACLVIDGKLIAFAEEERFTRHKGSFGAMPAHASKYCLHSAGLNLKDIDYVAFGWNASLYRFYMPLFVAKTFVMHAGKSQDAYNFYRVLDELIKYRPGSVKRYLKEMFLNVGLGGMMPPVHFIPHHLSHAASTFYTSGFDKAHILVIDGSGEDRCTSVFKGNGRNITPVMTFKIPHSLGWFYQSITEYLGFSPNSHEGKTMALAAYGKPDADILQKLKKMICYDEKGNYTYNPDFSFSGAHSSGRIYSDLMVQHLGEARKAGEPITAYHQNIAYSAQFILEEIVQRLVLQISKLPGYGGKLCIAGGVGLNCKMNGAVAILNEVEEIFVPPLSGDSGTALGAALCLAQLKGDNPVQKMEHAYWGPEYSNFEIEALLKQCKARYTKHNDIALTTARLLAENKILGWFQGRMEAGQRALGARSILANPQDKKMSNTINEEVKGRESWRPFAASIIYEYRDKFVTKPQPSAFMAISFNVKPEAVNKIAAAVHIDNTTRPQFVKKEDNPRYWKLISEFGNITGVYALLNTSFNTNEEPIVCTPQQALKCFYGSGMDYLAIGDFLVEK